MIHDLLLLMKSELALSVIIVLLFFIKIGSNITSPKILPLLQFVLLLNFLAGFIPGEEGKAFDGMYYSNELIVLQKNILNGGVYLISLLFSGWFKKQDHLAEFFMLLCVIE